VLADLGRGGHRGRPPAAERRLLRERLHVRLLRRFHPHRLLRLVAGAQPPGRRGGTGHRRDRAPRPHGASGLIDVLRGTSGRRAVERAGLVDVLRGTSGRRAGERAGLVDVLRGTSGRRAVERAGLVEVLPPAARRSAARPPREGAYSVGVKDFEALFAELTEKARTRPEGSGTVRELDGGVHQIGKKIVEEAAEVWMACEYESKDDAAMEISQLL